MGWSYVTVTVLILFHKYSASSYNDCILCVIVARL